MENTNHLHPADRQTICRLIDQLKEQAAYLSRLLDGYDADAAGELRDCFTCGYGAAYTPVQSSALPAILENLETEYLNA